MSWLEDFMPGAEERRATAAARANNTQDASPKIKDATGKEVSAKSANAPYLAYQEYRKKEETELQARKQRNKERLEKMARGETVGPPEIEELETELTLWDLIKFLVFVLAGIMLAGHFITGDYLWDYQGKYRHLKTFWPTGQTLFSESQLTKFDGTNEYFGVYIAIDHDVYDVSSNRRTYGPGGSYAFMAGKDTARAFATGCFKEHQTHDIRGLDEDEQHQLTHWKNFFANHKDYPKVGRVSHRPIDPASPIPADCDAQRAEARKKRQQETEDLAAARSEEKDSGNLHKEL